MVLCDNFYTPRVRPEVAWDLQQMVETIADFSVEIGVPFISGKDSSSGTFEAAGVKIEVPATLAVSALGRLRDVSKVVTKDFSGWGTASSSWAKLIRKLYPEVSMPTLTDSAVTGFLMLTMPPRFAGFGMRCAPCTSKGVTFQAALSPKAAFSCACSRPPGVRAWASGLTWMPRRRAAGMDFSLGSSLVRSCWRFRRTVTSNGWSGTCLITNWAASLKSRA